MPYTMTITASDSNKNNLLFVFMCLPSQAADRGFH
jgi:hypothetical protein